MVKEQVAIEFLTAHVETDLTANERETLAEFEQELADVVDQTGLQFAFAAAFGQIQEVENVRVLEGLLGEVGVLGRHREGEVGDRLAGALVQPTVYLEGEDVA